MCLKRFTTSDGLSLAYRDEGRGAPILCLPGLTRNMEDFDPIAEHFASRARIIRLDLRGRGESQFDPEFLNYNILVEARDVLELLDHLGLARAVIFGTSRGGLIALTLAALARDRMMGVIFNDIGPQVDPGGMSRITDTLGVLPESATLAAHAELFARNTAATFPGVGADAWRRFLARTMRETDDGIALRYDPKLRDAVIAHMQGSGMPDLWPVFDLCQGMPLLLLRGENSDILSAATAAEMLARRPDMAYVTVRDRGHIPFLDEPESLKAVGDFIASLKA